MDAPSRKPFPSDLTNARWAILEPLLPSPGRREHHEPPASAKVLNAAFYLLANGCKWSTLPHDFPPEGTVRDDIHQWRRNGLWERIHDILRRQVGEQIGKEPEPNAGSIGSLFAKSAQTGGMRGYDAGKEIYGIKRHILVDTPGLVLAVVVHPANIHDRDGAKLVFEKAKLKGNWPRMLCVWADGGYAGKLIERVLAFCQWALEIVKRNDDVKGFKLLPKRWVVERTFSWLSNYRRLSKHYEYWNKTWTTRASRPASS
jgi:putative transposase